MKISDKIEWFGISILILFLICNVFNLTFGQDYPNPVGYVNDFADVLTVGEEKTLEAILKSYEEKSTIEIVIVTIPSLNGETVEEYTVRLFEQWGVGKKGKDNGLVILNSIGDKKWRIEVGYGLEGFMTDAYAANIGDNYLTPNLKNGKYFDAYKQAVEQVMLRLGNLTDEDKTRMEEEDSDSMPLWLIIFVIIIVIFIILALLGSGGLGAGGGSSFGRSSSGGGGFGGFGGGGSGGGGASGGY